MRGWLALLAIVTLAGCLGGADPQQQPPVDTPAPQAPARMLPAGFSDSQQVVASAYNPTNYCHEPQVCHIYRFTVGPGWSEEAGRVRMTATLSWGLEASQIDLALFRGDSEVVSDYDTDPATSLTLAADLGEGDYALLLDAYAAVGDSFQLDVAFAPSA